MSAFSEISFATGEHLFEAGQPADKLYIIKEGSVELIDSRSGEVFVTLKAGQPFGEQALLRAGVRSATARAKEPTVCMELTATGLQQILQKESALSRIVFRALLLQLLMTNRLRHK
ncbi:cyclic nucleotide-binding domain-containing protein [Limnohabitans sp.]|jgi:CRP-like cAMP-binding protein|uniref:cyclic nucleotide-binding domain-containing protein n=1 Tax=Limnohabitans sp. TaxID=1907725 RepID=UPI0037C15FB0